MAEIHVETKKKTTPAWLWIVLAALVVAIIIYVAAKNKRSNSDNATNKSNQTSYIQLPGAMPVLS
jgi:archaellum component FlaF (FlaF/FlaG flagellin family)